MWRLDTGAGNDEILARDLGGGTTQVVAAGRGLSGGSIDGGTVAWAQPDATGTGTRIMARLLSGGAPFAIAAVPAGTVSDVLISGGTVAWIVDGGRSSSSAIETARLP